MAVKPTKQQIAQAKARAGGNNPVKVTNAGLKKLGSAAVIAATLTPAGRVLKTATTAVKTAKAAKAASIAQKKVYKEKVTIPAKRVVKAAKAELKSDARALKAANKPTNKVGSKADKEIRSRTKSVVLSKEETAALQDYYYGLPNLTQVMSRRVPKNDARTVRKSPVKLKKK